MPGGLTRVALDPTAARHLQPDGRRVEGHLGAGLRARDAVGLLAADRPDASPPSSPRRRCRPGPRRTCSGSAATPSGPRTSSGCCGSSTTGRNDFRPAPTRPAPRACDVLLAALTRRHRDLPRLRRRRRRATTPRATPAAPSCSPSSSTTTAPGTLAYAVRRLLDAAHAVRDQLSSDTWLVVGNLDRDLGRLGRSIAASSPPTATLGRVMQACSPSPAWPPRAWCATPAGGSWTPAGGSSGRSSWPTLLARTVTTEHDRGDRQPGARVGARPRPRASSPTAAATGPRPRSRRCSTSCCSTRQPAVAGLPARPAGVGRGQPARRPRADRDRLDRARQPCSRAGPTVGWPTPTALTAVGEAGATRRDLAALPRRRSVERPHRAGAGTLDADHFTHQLPQRSRRPWVGPRRVTRDLPGHPPHRVPLRQRRCRRATARRTCSPARRPASVSTRRRSRSSPYPEQTTASAATSSATGRLLRHPRAPHRRSPSRPPARRRSRPASARLAAARRPARGSTARDADGTRDDTADVLDARQFLLDSPSRRASRLRRRVRRAVVRARPARARGRRRPHAPDPRRLRVRPGRDDRGTTVDEVLDRRGRRVPGLRPPGDRLPARRSASPPAT